LSQLATFVVVETVRGFKYTNLSQESEKNLWNWLRYKEKNNDCTAKQAVVTRWHQKKTTEEHLEKRSGERNMGSGVQVQLEKDGDGSTAGWSVAYDTGSKKAYIK